MNGDIMFMMEREERERGVRGVGVGWV